MENVKTLVSKKLKNLMANKGLSQRKLVAYLKQEGIDVTVGAVNYWVNGLSVPSHGDNFDRLCKLLEINVQDTYGGLHEVAQRKFPLLGRVACGEPIWSEVDKDCFVMADSDITADFCVIAKGDSMAPMINDGDIVFVKQQPSVNKGEMAVVSVDNEVTLKRVYQSDDKITLIAINQAYEPIVILASENKDIRILGKAVFYQSLIK